MSWPIRDRNTRVNLRNYSQFRCQHLAFIGTVVTPSERSH